MDRAVGSCTGPDLSQLVIKTENGQEASCAGQPSGKGHDKIFQGKSEELGEQALIHPFSKKPVVMCRNVRKPASALPAVSLSPWLQHAASIPKHSRLTGLKLEQQHPVVEAENRQEVGCASQLSGKGQANVTQKKPEELGDYNLSHLFNKKPVVMSRNICKPSSALQAVSLSALHQHTASIPKPSRLTRLELDQQHPEVRAENGQKASWPGHQNAKDHDKLTQKRLEQLGDYDRSHLFSKKPVVMSRNVRKPASALPAASLFPLHQHATSIPKPGRLTGLKLDQQYPVVKAEKGEEASRASKSSGKDRDQVTQKKAKGEYDLNHLFSKKPVVVYRNVRKPSSALPTVFLSPLHQHTASVSKPSRLSRVELEQQHSVVRPEMGQEAGCTGHLIAKDFDQVTHRKPEEVGDHDLSHLFSKKPVIVRRNVCKPSSTSPTVSSSPLHRHTASVPKLSTLTGLEMEQQLPVARAEKGQEAGCASQSSGKGHDKFTQKKPEEIGEFDLSRLFSKKPVVVSRNVRKPFSASLPISLYPLHQHAASIPNPGRLKTLDLEQQHLEVRAETRQEAGCTSHLRAKDHAKLTQKKPEELCDYSFSHLFSKKPVVVHENVYKPPSSLLPISLSPLHQQAASIPIPSRLTGLELEQQHPQVRAENRQEASCTGHPSAKEKKPEELGDYNHSHLFSKKPVVVRENVCKNPSDLLPVSLFPLHQQAASFPIPSRLTGLELEQQHLEVRTKKKQEVGCAGNPSAKEMKPKEVCDYDFSHLFSKKHIVQHENVHKPPLELLPISISLLHQHATSLPNPSSLTRLELEQQHPVAKAEKRQKAGWASQLSTRNHDKVTQTKPEELSDYSFSHLFNKKPVVARRNVVCKPPSGLLPVTLSTLHQHAASIPSRLTGLELEQQHPVMRAENEAYIAPVDTLDHIVATNPARQHPNHLGLEMIPDGQLSSGVRASTSVDMFVSGHLRSPVHKPQPPSVPKPSRLIEKQFRAARAKNKTCTASVLSADMQENIREDSINHDNIMQNPIHHYCIGQDNIKEEKPLMVVGNSTQKARKTTVPSRQPRRQPVTEKKVMFIPADKHGTVEESITAYPAPLKTAIQTGRKASILQRKETNDKTKVQGAGIPDPKQALLLLQNEEWEKKIEGMNMVQSLAKNHPDLLLPMLHNVCHAVINEVKNLRKAVSRAAICTLACLFANLHQKMDQEVDLIASILLPKFCEAHYFIVEALDAALSMMVQNCSHHRVMQALLAGGVKHRAVAVREHTALHLNRLAEAMGAPLLLSGKAGIPCNFLPAICKLAMDPAEKVRFHSRNTLRYLAGNVKFHETVKKFLTPSDYATIKKIVAR